MANTYTTNLKLAQPASGDRVWNTPLNGNAALLDAMMPISNLIVTTHEQPSSSLMVDIAPGHFHDQAGATKAYAGITSQAIASGTTKTLYLDGTASWALVTTAASYPATPHVPLATVAAGASTITSIADNRKSLTVGGSIANGANMILGTVTGTQIGTAVGQKLAFWGATPVVQPLGAAQGAITDSTGSSATGTIPTIRNDSLAYLASDAGDGLHVINTQLAAIRTALVAAGIIKGSA